MAEELFPVGWIGLFDVLLDDLRLRLLFLVFCCIRRHFEGLEYENYEDVVKYDMNRSQQHGSKLNEQCLASLERSLSHTWR